MIPRPCVMPAIGAHGPGRLSVLIWAPVLAIDPLIDATGRTSGWSALAVVLAVLAAFTAAVLAAYRIGARRRHVLAALGVQTVVTFAAVATYGDHWFPLLPLLALAYGAVAPPRWSPVALLVVTVAGGVLTWWRAGDWTQTWATALTSFLAGFGTYVFHRLLAAIAELDATREELAREAVDRERLRFSRDLHDLLGHTLSVIVVKAEVIRRVLPADTDAASAHATDIEAIGREALAEVREAVGGYREAEVSHELDRAKIALEAAGVGLRVVHEGAALPQPVDALFGWVVREATTNVVRHAGAGTCTITLSGGLGSAAVTVADDGNGGGPPGVGEGLRGLRERARALGGSLEVTRSQRGFVLRVEVPTAQERVSA